jgi:hypothetical protein
VFAIDSSYHSSLFAILAVDGGAALPAAKRPAVQMPDEYLPPNKILFLQNLPETVTKDQLMSLFSQCVSRILPFALYPSLCRLSLAGFVFADSRRWILDVPFRTFIRYPNLHEVRLIPQKKDIAFVEFVDEGSAGVAKDALHNYKLDGENKIKVRFLRLFSPVFFARSLARFCSCQRFHVVVPGLWLLLSPCVGCACFHQLYRPLWFPSRSRFSVRARLL